MNIQQVINTFGNFIDECAIRYPFVSSNKDNILDRCFNLYRNNEGLFFSNAEIFGKGKPKSKFTNYLVINSDDETENLRNFYASIVLRYNNAVNNAHTLSDVVRAIQFSKEIESEKIPLYFFCGNKKKYAISSISLTEDELPKINGVVIERIDQLSPHLSIRCNSTESEQELQEQLNLLYRVFLKFNEREV